jgi:NCAIR mutase (PurE)-related protein
VNRKEITAMLKAVQQKRLSVEKAAAALSHHLVEDLGFAMIDHGREKRRGAPEVIFCQNKTPDQIKKISISIIKNGSTLLATRLSAAAFRKIKKDIPLARYCETSRTLTYIPKKSRKKPAGNVTVISAGTSDIPVAEEAAVTAEVFENRVVRIFDVGVAGIHRLFYHKKKIEEARVIVVVAGMEGALASVVGGLVRVPVIAVPTSVGYGASFNGVAALLSMLNSCASGVTVVNIDNGFGAGYAASQINKAISTKSKH